MSDLVNRLRADTKLWSDRESPYETLRLEAAARIEALERENAQLKARYTWAANELLAPDYGDNSTPDDAKQFGWIVYGWRRPRHRLAHTDEPRIWGQSIDAAIDEELTKPMGNYCAALSGTTPPDGLVEALTLIAGENREDAAAWMRSVARAALTAHRGDKTQES